MHNKIGTLAGEIWKLLKAKGEQKLSGLPKLLDEKAADVHLALGWLARENKVTFTDKKNVTWVALNGDN